MPRLTITLSEEKHQALKEMALRQGKSIRKIIEAHLDFYGVKTEDQARMILEQARQNAKMTEEEAIALAVSETRSYRKKHST